jgi:cell division protease FtsH
MALVACLIWTVMAWSNQSPSTISYSYFLKLLDGKDYEGNPYRDSNENELGCMIDAVEISEIGATGIFKNNPRPEPKHDGPDYKLVQPEEKEVLKKRFYVELLTGDSTREALLTKLEDQGVKVTVKRPGDVVSWYMAALILMTLGFLLFMLLSFRRQSSMMGGGGFLSNFSRSPAKKYEASEEPITFKDVAGLEGVKADLMEIVDFLSDPTKFQKLGGRVPKGVLLIGPPGTGKTLLARAVAGEAGVPYFSVNGSEFIQMFVGVGASRVRDLFATAKSQCPAIIFIDEIDAVGRQRGAGLGGGHDEREQTLNQILGEMDGFAGSDSVIILAATNRPDILDPALLRPGRFDRHVNVSRPTKSGRLAIFKVHVRDVPLGPDVDLEVMADATAGMTGADIQNLVNEAALWAARSNKTKVEMEDFYYAHDKVLMGAAREEVLTKKEKLRTAYHEAGHTIAAWFLPGGNAVHKVTVIPRGRALGVTQMVPDEDRMNFSEQEISDTLVVALAGRAAEQIIYGERTAGAENDLERATSMARRMVTSWGMSEKLGPVSYKMADDDPFLGREMQKSRLFSEHTMETIDEEVKKILDAAAERAVDLLKEKSDALQKITDGLMEHEELDRKQIKELIGPSVHDDDDDQTEQSSNDAEPANGKADSSSGQNGSVEHETENSESTTAE